MGRFKRLFYVICCYEHHIVWVPRYRFCVLTGSVPEEAQKMIDEYRERLDCEVEE
jgi:putative transposase